MMSYIKALSYYLPEAIVTNADLHQEFPEWDPEKIAKKIGINSRHLAAKDETAGDMAYKAAERLFAESGIKREDIDFVMLCTQSPDYFLPSTACVLQHRLGLRTDIGAFDFNLGCSGFVYGMSIAKGLIESGQAKNVLLLTSETYNKYIHPSDKSNRAIFGDAAAACVVSDTGVAEIGGFVFGTDGKGAENLIVKTGASKHPEKSGVETVDEEEHVWHEDYLYMNGGAIFNFTLEAVPQLRQQVLEKNQLADSDISLYVMHQANKYMLNTLRKIMGIDKDRFYIQMESVGNTVSSTLPIALKECIDKGTVKQGDTVMIAGFGVGLSYAGTILKF
ncbi:MAG: ketoacyl-ACP synthase III [Bacteroidales bacterium]|nr:ketoacyl-ACP synthase III [Bacteroidales bacterium]